MFFGCKIIKVVKYQDRIKTKSFQYTFSILITLKYHQFKILYTAKNTNTLIVFKLKYPIANTRIIQEKIRKEEKSLLYTRKNIKFFVYFCSTTHSNTPQDLDSKDLTLTCFQQAKYDLNPSTIKSRKTAILLNGMHGTQQVYSRRCVKGKQGLWHGNKVF